MQSIKVVEVSPKSHDFRADTGNLWPDFGNIVWGSITSCFV